MPIECPKCGSRYLRDSKPRNLEEKMGKFRFVSPLRCEDCKARFIAKTLVISDMFYAHCPECLRMDLNSWSGKTYEPTFWMRLLISFGAKRWRCEYCRKNFVDFRPRKEVFSFKRWERKNAGKVVAEGRAKYAEEEFRALAHAEVAEKEALKQAREAAEARLSEEAELRAEEEGLAREEEERHARKKKKVSSRLIGELEAPLARSSVQADRAAALAYTASLAKQQAAQLPTAAEPATALALAAPNDEHAPPQPPRIRTYSGAPELVYPKPIPVATPEGKIVEEIDEDSVHL